MVGGYMQNNEIDYTKLVLFFSRLIKSFNFSYSTYLLLFLKLHMKHPNLYHCSSFSFPVSVPRELDIFGSIDYDVQFEKSFVEPLKFITEKMNWLIDSSYGTQGSLDQFFT